MDGRFQRDELVYDGRIIQVHKVAVTMPDGRLAERDFIHFPGAAVVLPVLEDGSMVLIRNYRFAVGEHLYELPAGVLEPGEAPAVCAARELAEETGYRAGRLEKLGRFCSTPGTADEVLHAFVAFELSGGKQDLEAYEQIAVEVLPPRKVRSMVLDGTIHDAKTLATLALYWLRKDAT